MSLAEAELGPSTRALVTGGAGFVGGAVVEALLARGVGVRSFARGPQDELRERGVEVLRGDLGDAEAVAKACAGQDLVFHVAARSGLWGDRADFWRTNVEGTRHVLEGCRRSGVARLVYTSSPSVVFDGRDMCGADESAPYATHWRSAYPETKAEAERRVLAANGPELATVALRPHLVWGPGDPHFVPRIVARARAGRLRIVGDGSNRVDTVYRDDAARAHLLAAERLAPGSAVAGRAYFVSEGVPRPLWAMVNRILEAAGEPPVRRRIPAWLAHAAGALLEPLHRGLRLPGEPLMTRFLAEELSTSHWFDIAAARRDLGYRPQVSLEEGMARLAQWCAEVGLRGASESEREARTRG